MRRVLYAGLIVAVATFFALPPLGAAPRDPRGQGRPPALGPYVPDEVLVQFKPGIRADVAAAAVGARVHERIEGMDAYVLKVPEGTVEATLRALSRNPLVEYAEPNGYVHTFVFNDPNDPYDNPASCTWPSSDGTFTCQWFWEKVQAYDAWGVTTGNGVRVAVVDTGLDAGGCSFFGVCDDKHPDFTVCNRTITLKSYVSGESGNDDNSHGTHVGGVIGACTDTATPTGVAGANWNVHLLGVKVLNWYGSGSWSAVAKGINWAANNGAKVINLSLGGSTGSTTLRNAVNNAWNKGAVVVCAAGNSPNTTLSYPAYYTNCLAVAATNQNDQRASFSTYGSWVDVAAPGERILSMMQDYCDWSYLCWGYGYNELYDSLSGTSMATSVVSGLAALIWASGICGTSNVCVRNRIESLAYTDNNGTYGIGPAPGRGRVNFYKALTAP